MSDSDDELMALAGIGSDEGSVKDEMEVDDDEYEPEISTSRHVGKRQIEESDDEGGEPEEEADPYPLEGRFKDEEDRAKLLALDEMSREQILYDRLQEKEKLRERRFLALRARQSKAETSTMEQAGSETKRLRTSKLSELKRQRQRKDRRARGEADEYEDEDEDDDERDLEELAGLGDEDEAYYSDEYEPRKKSAAAKWDRYDDRYQKEATGEDLNRKIRSSRSVLDRYLYREEFDDVIPGTYIRVNVGPGRDGRPQYRVALIEEVKRDGNSYHLNGKPCNTYLVASQGKSKQVITISCLSDSPFTNDEFEQYKRRVQDADLELPTLGEVEDKFNQLREMSTKTLTDKDINNLVARKQRVVVDSASRVRQLANLREELQAAVERAEVEAIDKITKKIEELEQAKGKIAASNKMTKINLRNKKNTEQQIRKAELTALQNATATAKKLETAVKAAVIDPNNPFSKLVDGAVRPEKKDVDAENLIACRYRKDGLEAAVKDIPLEIELQL